MFELEYMKVYSGAVIENALKYGNPSNEIVRCLSERFEFRQRVSKPARPHDWAPKRVWDEYRFQEERYRAYQRSVSNTSKFVLDSKLKYVITHNKGIIWLNYRTSKEVSRYSRDILTPWKCVGCTIKETGQLIILQCGKIYLVDFEAETIEPWSDN